MEQPNKLSSYLELQLHTGEWQRRWFVLTHDDRLCFYKSSAAVESRGQIELDSISGSNMKAPQPPHHNYVFSIELTDNNFLCVCSDTEELRQQWMEALVGPRGSAYPTQVNSPPLTVENVSSVQNHMTVQKTVPVPVGGSGIVHTGWLKKRSEMFRRWKPRFFVLTADRILKYYEDDTQQSVKGTIPLDHVHKMKPVDVKKYGQSYSFELVSASTVYAFSAESEQQRNEWMSKIESVYNEVTKLIPLKEGGLIKRSNVRKRWKRRWFMLWGGWLFYFASQEECEKFRRNSFFNDQVFRTAFNRYVKGAMELFKCQVKAIGGLDMFRDVFVISSESRKLYLVADSVDEMNAWIEAITSVKLGNSGAQFSPNINLWTNDFTEATNSLSSARSLSAAARSQSVNTPKQRNSHLYDVRRFSTGIIKNRRQPNVASWHSPGSFPFRQLRGSFRTYGGKEGIIDLDHFIRICRELELDLDQERLEILFQLLDLDIDDAISFADVHSTFHREQKNHPDLTPRELILQYITTHQQHLADGDASTESYEESDENEETLHRAVMIEGVPDFVRENDQFILELEQLIFKEFQPLQTEIVGECLEIIFAYDIKRSDMKVMERDLKELLSEFARDRKERLETEKGLKVRALTAEELEDSLRYNKHLFEEKQEEVVEEAVDESYEHEDTSPEMALTENLLKICRNINVSHSGYLVLTELLVFFARLQGVALKEVPLEHPVMRQLNGCSITESVEYLKTVDRHILHIPAMLEASRSMTPHEVKLAQKYIETLVYADADQEGSVITMTLGTNTLLDESFSE